MGDAKRSRSNINKVSNDRCKTRKETLQQLLKLTNEITSNFKKEKGGICQKPLNGFPDPPKRPYARSVPTATVEGRTSVPKQYQTMYTKRRNMSQQGMAISRGPALNPTVGNYMKNTSSSSQTPTQYYTQKFGNTYNFYDKDNLKTRLKIAMTADQTIATNVCYEWTERCNKLEVDRGGYFKSEDNCQCKGCTSTCNAVGPHSHREVSDCVQDYCNYPCFEPRIANMAGNYWSGEVFTRCIYPEPCKADCFDHRPPGDYNDVLHL